MSSAAAQLNQHVRRLGETFPGDVGIVVRDVQTGWTSHYRGLDYFPQQSVSKLWVALSLFDQIDRGTTGLANGIVVRPEDLTLFHQPIRALALRPGGFRTTNEDLVLRALTQSDNSANDRLLNLVGGPAVVRTTLGQKGITSVRFGPGETLMQSQIAGLAWKSEYSLGQRFFDARDALPAASRRAAFNAYIADPVDGATPLGIADALARLKQGSLLSPASTSRMLSIMAQTRTGPQRLKGGLRNGWSLSHKTGTGQIFQGEQAGYNDVGILTSPDGQAYAVAVLIGRTRQPLPERMKLMHRVVAATIEYDAQLAAQRAAAASPSEPTERSS
ncbi:serine hydrolase [Sphingomonas sp. ASY06-1R]|uniref:serine hydrolase n=1 Tax=Sphingomonas sp. ASY06-1R TaxID=3445771 RepID=UPI003FA26336